MYALLATGYIANRQSKVRKSPPPAATDGGLFVWLLLFAFSFGPKTTNEA
jgi:hypothetical protein